MEVQKQLHAQLEVLFCGRHKYTLDCFTFAAPEIGNFEVYGVI